MPAKDQTEYMRKYRERKKLEAEQPLEVQVERATKQVRTRQAQNPKTPLAEMPPGARKAGYSSWPPSWEEIIPKLSQHQIDDILRRVNTTGRAK